MKLIQQLHENGCGPACLAMVAGLTYYDCTYILRPDDGEWKKVKGTKWHELLLALKHLNIKYRRKRGQKGLFDCKTAIVGVSWKKGTANWHFVVWHNNKIYDPEFKKPISKEKMLKNLPVIRSYVEIL